MEVKERLLGKDEEETDDGDAEEDTGSEPSPEVIWQDELYSCREVG